MTDDAPPGTPEPGDDAPAFDAPWMARAFALAVAFTDEEDLPWREFQSRLVAEIDDAEVGETPGSDESDPVDDDPEGTYYRQWLAALERLLIEEGLVGGDELADRVAAFEAGDRTAHEFVEGDPHAHAERLPEGHAEGSHHDHGGHGDGENGHGSHSHEGHGHSH